MATLGKEIAGIAARKAALEILLRVSNQGSYADVLLGNRLPEFQENDRRLITLLVLGTLAWRGRLDYEIAQLSSRKLALIDPAVLEILRLGLFQLRFLDRVPRHAAVNTAVTIANSDRRTRNASGLVNAVLRKATREEVPLPDRARDEIEHLSVKWSHPRWMVERFVESFGRDDAEALMEADNQAAPTAIRLNPLRGTRAQTLARITSAGLEIASAGRFEETLILRGAPGFDSAPFKEGLFQVQAEASQLVARMLAPSRAATVADLAAAPGGKSTHLAELVGERGRVVALDLNFAGLRSAQSVARRLGHRNIVFARADIAGALPLRPQSFDYVLLDAPCTGTGTLREHPEIRWRVKPDDPSRMAVLQRTLLRSSASLLRRGGALLYSVCSMMPEEGEEVVAEFIASNPEFQIDVHPPAYEQLRDVIRDDGTLLTRPDRAGLDGFFAARITRRR